MLIRINILPDASTKQINLSTGSKIHQLLSKLQLLPDNVIILRGDTPIPIDDILTSDQELTLVRVSSRG
jgi:sulfur carrier protein ThiS